MLSGNADQHDQGNDVEASFRGGGGQIEAAYVEETPSRNGEALSRRRQRLQHREVPEEQLQQQRNVAHHFDVNRRETGDQPVGGKTRDADHEPQNGGDDDAKSGDQQGIEKPDQECPAVGHRAIEVDQRLGNIKSSGAVDESKSGGDVLLAQVAGGIVYEHVEERDEKNDEHHLIDGLAHLGAVEKGRLRVLRSRPPLVARDDSHLDLPALQADP